MVVGVRWGKGGGLVWGKGTEDKGEGESRAFNTGQVTLPSGNEKELRATLCVGGSRGPTPPARNTYQSLDGTTAFLPGCSIARFLGTSSWGSFSLRCRNLLGSAKRPRLSHAQLLSWYASPPPPSIIPLPLLPPLGFPRPPRHDRQSHLHHPRQPRESPISQRAATRGVLCVHLGAAPRAPVAPP